MGDEAADPLPVAYGDCMGVRRRGRGGEGKVATGGRGDCAVLEVGEAMGTVAVWRSDPVLTIGERTTDAARAPGTNDGR